MPITAAITRIAARFLIFVTARHSRIEGLHSEWSEDPSAQRKRGLEPKSADFPPGGARAPLSWVIRAGCGHQLGSRAGRRLGDPFARGGGAKMATGGGRAAPTGGAGPPMWKATIRGLLARRIRLVVTALAVLLGVAFVSATYVLTDTVKRSFDSVFSQT